MIIIINVVRLLLNNFKKHNKKTRIFHPSFLFINLNRLFIQRGHSQVADIAGLRYTFAFLIFFNRRYG